MVKMEGRFPSRAPSGGTGLPPFFLVLLLLPAGIIATCVGGTSFLSPILGFDLRSAFGGHRARHPHPHHPHTLHTKGRLRLLASPHIAFGPRQGAVLTALEVPRLLSPMSLLATVLFLFFLSLPFFFFFPFCFHIAHPTRPTASFDAPHQAPRSNPPARSTFLSIPFLSLGFLRWAPGQWHAAEMGRVEIRKLGPVESV